MSDKIERQNEIIIALLARNAIGLNVISKIVCGGKRNPEAYRKAYNALQGNNGVTDIAKIAGVSQPTMSVILQAWEEQGIIFNVGSNRKPQYHRLLFLPRIKPGAKEE